MNKKCVSEKGKPQWRGNEQWTSYEHYKQWTKRRQNKWRQIEWRENELTQNEWWVSNDKDKINFLCWWVALWISILTFVTIK